MSLEQYIVRELKEDIKYLIKRVTEIEKKIDELKPDEKVYTLSHDAGGDVYTESKKMQDELEPIVPEEDETFKISTDLDAERSLPERFL